MPSSNTVHLTSISVDLGGAGNRACRRPLRPPSNLNRLLTQMARIFSGFGSRRPGAAKPERFVSKQAGRLKAVGALWAQPGLAAARKAKSEEWAEARCRLKRNLQKYCAGPLPCGRGSVSAIPSVGAFRAARARKRFLRFLQVPLKSAPQYRANSSTRKLMRNGR
jgi:hypothetical protein